MPRQPEKTPPPPVRPGRTNGPEQNVPIPDWVERRTDWTPNQPLTPSTNPTTDEPAPTPQPERA